METLRRFNFPRTIDISMTGACQLNCAWCWGEKHTIKNVHGEDVWKNLLLKFKEVGTSHVVFTGGEPLLSPILPTVLRYAKETLSLRTTLSTNAILLGKLHGRVLPWVDDLGISLDGSTPKVNKDMRAGRIDNFQSVTEGIKLAELAYPGIDLTVRTVIARPNVDDVQNIPNMLSEEGIDISRIRFKFYQVEPIGPRADITDTDMWRVSEDECRAIASTTRRLYPGLSIVLQLYSDTSGRYYQIGPRGNAYGTYIDHFGKPQMVNLGNPINDFDQALEMIATNYSFQSTH